jgi:hypothetical protein
MSRRLDADLASSRTIACGPVSGARSSCSARVFSIELICSRTTAGEKQKVEILKQLYLAVAF